MAATKALVKEYMTEKVDYIPAETTVEKAIEIFVKSTHHTFPVTRKGNLLGFITAKDLLGCYKTPKKQVKEITQGKILVARPELALDDAARVMFRSGLRQLPVVDDKGRLIGIVTNTDILRSHIERATPRKVDMVKNLLESKHGVKIKVRMYPVPLNKLRPTQTRIHADELQGRLYELKRGLAEPLIVVKRKNYFVLVDGHHRVIAAKELGIKEIMAHVLEPESDIETGMEKAAKDSGLLTLDDIKIIDDAQHPLVEITTKLVKKNET